jgi:hypothetical protein
VDKLNIRNEMAQLDRKNRGFYQSLTDEERRKFSTFLMIRWSSSVSGSAELQEYYVQACNHFLNRHFFAINRHPQLQWLAATAVSPGTGTPDHVWIKGPSRERGSTAQRRRLQDLYPNMKNSDIDVLIQLNEEADFRRLERDHGID